MVNRIPKEAFPDYNDGIYRHVVELGTARINKAMEEGADLSVQDLEMVISTFQDSVGAAIALCGLGKKEEAEMNLRRKKRLQEKLHLAVLLIREGQMSEGREMLAQLAECREAKAYGFLGLIFLNDGHIELAKDYWEKGYELGDLYSQYLLGRERMKEKGPLASAALKPLVKQRENLIMARLAAYHLLQTSEIAEKSKWADRYKEIQGDIRARLDMARILSGDLPMQTFDRST